jgi:hypothetical protein
VRRWPSALLIFVTLSCGNAGDGKVPPDPGPNAPPASPDPVPSSTPPLPAPTSLDCKAGTSLTYENFGEAYMLNYCTACHSAHLAGAARNGAPAGQDFDTANDVKLWRSAILDDTSGSAPKMPPVDNVSTADAAELTQWLNCGAPSLADKGHLP